MTALSVNLNKIALLRNSRGRDYPNVLAYAEKLIGLQVHGLTVHPRQDERHATRQDTRDLAELCRQHPAVEFNVEGYPSAEFMALIAETCPDQCTLVPDAPDQLTSDHGWDLTQHLAWVTELAAELKSLGVRSSLFLDPQEDQIRLAGTTGVDRIELYTESYALAHAQGEHAAVLARYAAAAQLAQELGLGVNAGHDLDLHNLADFLTIPHILEVSIGHALTVESLEYGVAEVIARYLKICA
ncbi:pyridoxine 5'-phosphate synthase [Marinicella meishanensis]|uniref:pyridoxine 5'-phosphate synthase n=1 Tax=Marinicella meishanensis TaxID=2873263 RepID=UPI001CBC8A8E|nr:pyridoxine 5'-phosphate synthase [Marinicella sp. NBU2979]